MTDILHNLTNARSEVLRMLALCHWARSSWSFKGSLCLNCKVKQIGYCSQTASPWRWRHNPMKCQELFTWHSVTSQQTCSFSAISHTTTVRVSNWQLGNTCSHQTAHPSMPAAYHEAPLDSWHVLSLYCVLQAVLLKWKYHANKNMDCYLSYTFIC